jgi:hypothetical protein
MGKIHPVSASVSGGLQYPLAFAKLRAVTAPMPSASPGPTRNSRERDCRCHNLPLSVVLDM